MTSSGLVYDDGFCKCEQHSQIQCINIPETVKFDPCKLSGYGFIASFPLSMTSSGLSIATVYLNLKVFVHTS